MATFKSGWRPDKPDIRDYVYAAPDHALVNKGVVDLRPYFPAVFDQKELGACTANAISAALQFDAIKNNQYDKDVVHSRLFIYYNERAMEGSVDSDAGAEIRDGIKSVATVGACNESLWWYNIVKFKVKPSKVAYDNAKKYKALQYMRVGQSLDELKACLNEGFPIVGGFTVYDSFMSDEVALTGIVPMPKATESVQGGHAVVIAGYDDNKQSFLVRNSWSDKWGIGGYCYMPYAYWTNTNLADDLWTLRVVS